MTTKIIVLGFSTFSTISVLVGCASSPPLTRVPKTGPASPTVLTIPAPAPAAPSAPSSTQTPRKGAFYQDDGPGDAPPNLALIPDAEPRAEPYSRTANRPYNVFGMDFAPDTSDKPFKQRGAASWYGRKFHGQKTSSGEIYDMYAMTAAHPTLPIPSYAKVTSVATGQSVIVRVNDRGPFIGGRIMDLSYAAAARLGYADQGTGTIEVERLLPHDILAGKFKPSPWVAQAPSLNTAPAPAATVVAVRAPDAGGNSRLDPDIPADLRLDNIASMTSTLAIVNSPLVAVGVPTPTLTPTIPTPIATHIKGYLLQLAAFRSRAIADEFKEKVALELDAALSARLIITNAMLTSGEWFRVQLGPYTSRSQADSAAQTLRASVGSNYRPIVVLQP